jgi:hypothetical protein
VALVIGRLAFAGGAERLARATSRPNRSVIGPSGKSEGVGPPADAGKEMALRIAPEIAGSHVDDASLVDIAWRDVSGGDEVAEPLGGIRVDLVVVGGHGKVDLRSGAVAT